MAKTINIEVNDNGHKQPLTLKVYSTGDGALGVNCVYPENPSGEAAPFLADDADVVKFRDTHFRDYGVLKNEGESRQYRFFKPVERESDNRVIMEGRIYRYEFEPEAVADRVKLFGVPKNSVDGKEIQVGNTVLEDALDFYLRHEDKILESRSQFGNEEAFKLSVSGQARQERAAGFNM